MGEAENRLSAINAPRRDYALTDDAKLCGPMMRTVVADICFAEANGCKTNTLFRCIQFGGFRSWTWSAGA
jgi:hypothetical protein